MPLPPWRHLVLCMVGKSKLLAYAILVLGVVAALTPVSTARPYAVERVCIGDSDHVPACAGYHPPHDAPACVLGGWFFDPYVGNPLDGDAIFSIDCIIDQGDGSMGADDCRTLYEDGQVCIR